MGASLSYVSDLGLLPLVSSLFFSFGLPPFSSHLAPIFFLNFSPKFALTHSSPPITLFYPPSLISRSCCLDFFYSISNRYHGLILAVASLKRDFSHLNRKIGRALARVHAPPPSMFYFRGLLAPPDLGFVCLDLFSKLWLQISCYGANLYCGEEDISVFRSSFFFCFSIFRVILFGLWCWGLLTSCNFGVPCTNSATTAMVDVGGAGFVAAEEDMGFVSLFPSFFLLL